jgi:hypothetical protein
LGFLVFGLKSQGDDISSTVFVNRFAITNGSTFMDTGYLLNSGNFKMMFTENIDLLFVPPSDIDLLAGRPVIAEDEYNLQKFARTIPNWVRSKLSFPLLDTTYVIVGIKGKIDPNPTITIRYQPINAMTTAGQNASFYCFADPLHALSYQWFFKGKPIPGATSDILGLSNVTKKNAGIYQAALSTGGKPVMSKRALLQVIDPVVIKTQPKSLSVKTNQRASFRVTATGTHPLSYYWYHNGTLLGSKPVWIIPHVTAEDAGEYQVRVLNSLSGALSEIATLTVTQ